MENASMGFWNTDRILGALDSFDEEPLPNDIAEVVTADYRLLHYPERLLSPTFPAAQVLWSKTSRSLDDLFVEIEPKIKEWGLDEMHWWVSPATRPLQTENFLRARGGELSDSFQLLALELPSNTLKSDTPLGIRVELVNDERTFRDSASVATRGWGRSPEDEMALSLRLNEVLSNLEMFSGYEFVAYVDGKPASTGSCKMSNDVVRLWGAVTFPEFRGRGCYRAVLASRLRQAEECGATLAVTRGRPLTSGAILIQNGFRAHREAHCYRLTIR